MKKVILILTVAALAACSNSPTEPQRITPPENCLDCPTKIPNPPPQLNP